MTLFKLGTQSVGPTLFAVTLTTLLVVGLGNYINQAEEDEKTEFATLGEKMAYMKSTKNNLAE